MKITARPITHRIIVPTRICSDCGQKYGTRQPGPRTVWSMGSCGVCHEYTQVTAPREYGVVVVKAKSEDL